MGLSPRATEEGTTIRFERFRSCPRPLVLLLLISLAPTATAEPQTFRELRRWILPLPTGTPRAAMLEPPGGFPKLAAGASRSFFSGGLPGDKGPPLPSGSFVVVVDHFGQPEGTAEETATERPKRSLEPPPTPEVSSKPKTSQAAVSDGRKQKKPKKPKESLLERNRRRVRERQEKSKRRREAHRQKILGK